MKKIPIAEPGTRGPNQLHKLPLHGVTLGGRYFVCETVMGCIHFQYVGWANYNDQTAVLVRESPPESLKSSGLGIFTYFAQM